MITVVTVVFEEKHVHHYLSYFMTKIAGASEKSVSDFCACLFCVVASTKGQHTYVTERGFWKSDVSFL